MKYSISRSIGFFDVSHDRCMTLEAMARIFQKMATDHSAHVGAGPDYLFPRGLVWFLNRLEIQVFNYPLLGDRLRVSTWSRGFRHYMGLREYRMDTAPFDPDTGPAVLASSVWIFYDFKNRRVRRVPRAMADLYPFDPERNFDTELQEWRPHAGAAAASAPIETDISLRFSDFDVNGHVNNTIYPGFVETLFTRAVNSVPGARIRQLRLNYSKEIPLGTPSVTVGCHAGPDRHTFVVSPPASGGPGYALGDFSFFVP